MTQEQIREMIAFETDKFHKKRNQYEYGEEVPLYNRDADGNEEESICVDEDYESRVARLRTMIDERERNPEKYDDSIVRQMIECIKVYRDGRIEIIFGGGYTVEEVVGGEQKHSLRMKTHRRLIGD